MNKIWFVPLACLAILITCQIQSGAAKPKIKHERAWTVQDTISHSLNHSPVMKRDHEGVNRAKENVKQAKSGHYPKVNVEASGGASTLPVSRNE